MESKYAIKVYNFVIASYFLDAAGLMSTLVVTERKPIVQETTRAILIRYLLYPLSINVDEVLVLLMSTQAPSPAIGCFTFARIIVASRRWMATQWLGLSFLNVRRNFVIPCAVNSISLLLSI